MSDPLSIIASAIGLVATSAKIATTAKQLYDSGKDAPASIRRIGEEMDQLHLIFGQVQTLLEGHARKRPSRSRLTMLPLHHLMTILSGCVLAYSSLDKKLTELGRVGFGARVKWALWKEAEAGVILLELERHKASLHMMLTIIQCNSTKEASQQLSSLHELVEKIWEKISESNNEVAVQLRELISEHPDSSDDTSDFSISDTTDRTTSTERSLIPSSISTTFSTISRSNDTDCASIRTTSSSSSIRSVRYLMPSWGEELKNSRPYKRLWRKGVDSSSGSVLSTDSAIKGDTWSMLSDLSLGDLSISEVSVLELPISLSDLYDPTLYQQSPRHKARRGVNWGSRGRLHKAIYTGNIFIFRTLLNLGADPNEANEYGPLLVYAARRYEGIEFCRSLLDRGVQVDTRDSSGSTPLSYAARLYPYGAICELLLDRGAAVDSTDSNGRTPLSHCAGRGYDSVCELLLGRGAAVDSTDFHDRTPLSYSAELNVDDSVCELLLERGGMVDLADSQGRTPLSYSAEQGNCAISRVLLNRGARAETPDFKDRTPLSHAYRWGEASDIYQLLLKAKESGC